MTTPTSTKANINILTEFRQAVDTRIFHKRRDALFETLDALLAGGTFAAFAALRQSERLRRQWPSLYAAVEDGQVDGDALGQLLMQQLPQEGICLFLLDGFSWPGPRRRVLEDLQYVYQASSDADGGKVTVGYPSLLLQWCAEAHSSWSLSLEVRWISSQQPAQDVGVEHIRALDKAPQACLGALEHCGGGRKIWQPTLFVPPQRLAGCRPTAPRAGVVPSC